MNNQQKEFRAQIIYDLSEEIAEEFNLVLRMFNYDSDNCITEAKLDTKMEQGWKGDASEKLNYLNKQILAFDSYGAIQSVNWDAAADEDSPAFFTVKFHSYDNISAGPEPVFAESKEDITDKQWSDYTAHAWEVLYNIEGNDSLSDVEKQASRKAFYKYIREEFGKNVLDRM